MTTLYLAGPMTGIEDYNYPAFHAAAAQLREAGYVVVNPAENFAGDQSLPWETYLRTAICQVTECDGIALLPGWQESKGAKLEVRVAGALGIHAYGLAVWLACEPGPRIVETATFESVLEEAQRIVHGARQQAYGHPREDFARTAGMWSAILGIDVEPHHVALCMIALKLGRLAHSPGHRDSIVDVAGYAATLDMLKGDG